MRTNRLLGIGLIALGAAIATAALLGPLVLNVLSYRTSPTTLNQIVGSDAAALIVVAPVSVLIGLLALRGHRAAPVLALAPAIFAVYTYTQLIVGNEYLRLPGNVERFFPLLLGVFVLAGGITVVAWSVVELGALPPASRRTDRTAGVVLMVIAAFVVFGLHLPSYIDAMRIHPTTVAYVSSPTPFWLVKLMDLGIVVPVAIAVGVGMLRRRASARKPMYALIGGYTLLGASVAGMAITMYLNDDPDASVATLVSSTGMALVLAVLAGYVYRPLLRRRTDEEPGPGHPQRMTVHTVPVR